MALKDDLKRLIDKRGASITKLARLAGIHPDTISKFLNGETEMTAANLDKLFVILADAQPSNGNNNIIHLNNKSQDNSVNLGKMRVSNG